jgi:cytochrome c oxidase assembly protein subunit 15
MAGMFVTGRHRNLLLAATTVTLLLIALGGVVCVTDASRGCPDWPGCYGQVVPPLRVDSILEYSHRVLAAAAFLLVAASAVYGRLKARSIRWVSWPPIAATFLLLLVAGLGAMGVVDGLSPGLAALDLGSALLVLALMVVATTVAVVRHRHPDVPDRLQFKGLPARWAPWSLVAVFVVLVSAVLVAASGSVVRCMSWPLFASDLRVEDGRGWALLVRQFLAVGATGLVAAVLVGSWRRQPRWGGLQWVTALAGILLLIELVLVLVLSLSGYSLVLQLAFSVTAAGLWASLVVVTVLLGLPFPVAAVPEFARAGQHQAGVEQV